MIPLDILRDVLANVANPGPWSVADHHNYRHVVNADGNIIADDVGDDAPLIAAAPDLARDVLSLAAALRTLAAQHAGDVAAAVAGERERIAAECKRVVRENTRPWELAEEIADAIAAPTGGGE